MLYVFNTTLIYIQAIEQVLCHWISDSGFDVGKAIHPKSIDSSAEPFRSFPGLFADVFRAAIDC